MIYKSPILLWDDKRNEKCCYYRTCSLLTSASLAASTFCLPYLNLDPLIQVDFENNERFPRRITHIQSHINQKLHPQTPLFSLILFMVTFVNIIFLNARVHPLEITSIQGLLINIYFPVIILYSSSFFITHLKVQELLCSLSSNSNNKKPHIMTSCHHITVVEASTKSNRRL